MTLAHIYLANSIGTPIALLTNNTGFGIIGLLFMVRNVGSSHAQFASGSERAGLR